MTEIEMCLADRRGILSWLFSKCESLRQEGIRPQHISVISVQVSFDILQHVTFASHPSGMRRAALRDKLRI